MLKKVFSTVILVMALTLITSPSNFAEASDYYIGTYSDGSNAYLVTESVRIKRNPFSFVCKVKYSSTSLWYYFYQTANGPYYENTEGYQAYVFGGNSPVAENIYRFVWNNS